MSKCSDVATDHHHITNRQGSSSRLRAVAELTNHVSHIELRQSKLLPPMSLLPLPANPLALPSILFSGPTQSTLNPQSPPIHGSRNVFLVRASHPCPCQTTTAEHAPKAVFRSWPFFSTRQGSRNILIRTRSVDGVVTPVLTVDVAGDKRDNTTGHWR